MGYFIVCVIAASVLLALAFYAYGPVVVGNAFRSVYREIKHVVGTIARRGWRPLLPWVFIFVAGGIGWRVVSGLPLTVDVVQLVGVLGPLVLPTVLGQWTRSIEARAGVANGGGIVNNDALQASA